MVTNGDWPEHFLKRVEVWAYMERVADQYDNRRYVRCNTEVTSTIHKESLSDWDTRIRSADGTTESPIEKDAIVTNDGTGHEADPIVLATGFIAREVLWQMHVQGRGGQTIRDFWGDNNPRAHGGSTIGHTECEVRYIVQCPRALPETGAKTMASRREPLDACNRRLDETHADMVWARRGVGNRYKNKDGRGVTISPFRLVDYRRMTGQLDRNDYIMA